MGGTLPLGGGIVSGVFSREYRNGREPARDKCGYERASNEDFCRSIGAAVHVTSKLREAPK